METLEFNKYAGGLLATLLFTMSLGIVSNAIYSNPAPAKPGYALPSAAPVVAVAKAADEVPLPVLLAKADVTKGAADAKACGACHNFGKGEGIKVGPPLYGVVNRPVGSVAGFGYSEGVKGKGGNWSIENINAFITNPKAYITGTKMSYPGQPDAAKRADILAYLNSLADAPAPLPTK